MRLRRGDSLAKVRPFRPPHLRRLMRTECPAAFPGFPFREETGLEVNHSPEESLRLLKEKIRSLFPEATDKQMEKMLA